MYIKITSKTAFTKFVELFRQNEFIFNGNLDRFITSKSDYPNYVFVNKDNAMCPAPVTKFVIWDTMPEGLGDRDIFSYPKHEEEIKQQYCLK